EEGGRLRDQVVPGAELLDVPRPGRNLAKQAAVLVDLVPAAVDEPGSRRLERRSGGADRTRQVEIVGVQPAEDLPFGHPAALVERVGLPRVGPGDPAEMRKAGP